LTPHKRKYLALEMTRCLMEESVPLAKPLLHLSKKVQHKEEHEEFDLAQCHDSHALYSSSWTLQQCVRRMNDKEFPFYTRLVIAVDSICASISRSQWEYTVMESAMKALETFQNIDVEQQSMQELSQGLIDQIHLVQSNIAKSGEERMKDFECTENVFLKVMDTEQVHTMRRVSKSMTYLYLLFVLKSNLLPSWSLSCSSAMQ